MERGEVGEVGHKSCGLRPRSRDPAPLLAPDWHLPAHLEARADLGVDRGRQGKVVQAAAGAAAVLRLALCQGRRQGLPALRAVIGACRGGRAGNHTLFAD